MSAFDVRIETTVRGVTKFWALPKCMADDQELLTAALQPLMDYLDDVDGYDDEGLRLRFDSAGRIASDVWNLAITSTDDGRNRSRTYAISATEDMEVFVRALR